jgi:hypothetical protein
MMKQAWLEKTLDGVRQMQGIGPSFERPLHQADQISDEDGGTVRSPGGAIV